MRLSRKRKNTKIRTLWKNTKSTGENSATLSCHLKRTCEK